MMNKKMVVCLTFVLSACVVQPPSVSSNVIESSSAGSLISINTEYCGAACTDLALKKAKEVCPKGFVIKNQVGGVTGNSQVAYMKDVNMVVRCEN